MNWNVFIKGFTYVALAVLTSLYACNGPITMHEAIGITIAGFIALRSYMDQSIGIQNLINSNQGVIDANKNNQVVIQSEERRQLPPPEGGGL